MKLPHFYKQLSVCQITQFQKGFFIEVTYIIIEHIGPTNLSKFSFTQSWHLWFTFLFLPKIFLFDNARRSDHTLNLRKYLRKLLPRSELAGVTNPRRIQLEDISFRKEHYECCSVRSKNFSQVSRPMPLQYVETKKLGELPIHRVM